MVKRNVNVILNKIVLEFTLCVFLYFRENRNNRIRSVAVIIIPTSIFFEDMVTQLYCTNLFNASAIHEAIDSRNYSVRIFFADFAKGFDVIDHSVLLDELKSFDIDQTLFFWVPSFLTNRVQAVRVGSSLSSWKQVNGGIPQGTKLDLTLFAVMINMRSKYVDDTTAFEIIPRNSTSILDLAVREI